MFSSYAFICLHLLEVAFTGHYSTSNDLEVGCIWMKPKWHQDNPIETDDDFLMYVYDNYWAQPHSPL